MRITQGMLSSNMLRHLMQSQEKMDTYFEQLYTGKKISRPSDDPVVAMKGMKYRTRVGEVDQYKRNTKEVHNWMDNSDAALDRTTQALQRMRELAVQASNATYGNKERQSIKKEVEQLKEHLIDIANTNVNDKFIFNGTNTNKAPIKVNNENIDIQHNSEKVFIEVSKGTLLQVNIDGASIFADDLFTDVIDDFISKLDNNGDPEDLINIGASLGKLDEQINNVIDARAEVGARMNRLELIENRLDEQKVIATRTMSENEDIHFEEAITNLITQESLHRAALATGSKIIQPTLIDFLR